MPANNGDAEVAAGAGRRPRRLLKVAVTLGLLIYLAAVTDWRRTAASLTGIELLPFVASYLVLLLCSLPLGWRLRTLLEPTELRFGLRELIEIQFTSQFYGSLVPSGVGIGVARWYQITRNRVGRRVFLVIIAIERAMLALTLAACSAVPLLLAGDERLGVVRAALLPPLGLLLAAGLSFFVLLLVPPAFRWFAALMRSLVQRTRSRLAAKLLGVHEDFGLYVARRDVLVRAFSHHLVFQALNFVRFYLVFVALGVDLPAATVLWVSMLVVLLVSLPLSVGGLGVRESGYAWLLALYGIEPERALLVGAVITSQFFLNVGVGGLLATWRARRVEP